MNQRNEIKKNDENAIKFKKKKTERLKWSDFKKNIKTKLSIISIFCLNVKKRNIMKKEKP